MEIVLLARKGNKNLMKNILEWVLSNMQNLDIPRWKCFRYVEEKSSNLVLV